MIVPVMAMSNLVLTQQIYSEETNGAHAHYREPVPLIRSMGYYFRDEGKEEIIKNHIDGRESRGNLICCLSIWVITRCG